MLTFSVLLEELGDRTTRLGLMVQFRPALDLKTGC